MINLMIAAFFEVFWAVMMNYSQGFTKLIPSIATCIGYILSAVFLSMALKELPLGISYAIWTGIGMVGTTILGVLLFHETLNMVQFVCIILIISGIAGLKLFS